MKLKYILILFLCISVLSCSDDKDGDFIESSLVVIDKITNQPRANQNIILKFFGNDDKVYENTRRTDDNGKVFFKGSADGRYRAEFSYFPGTSSDNFFDFDLSGNKDDITMMVSPVEKSISTPAVITGIMIDPMGWDQGKTGANVTWGDGSIKQHDGSYEYVQFLALEDIDFSKTPYSVIFARNGAVSAKGWAQGGNVTYKFELTTGFAAKGTFFYVGGNAKRIAGFNKSCEHFSTKIDDANWIRVINYPTVAGDGGIGNKTDNLDVLHNGNNPSSGANIADGIAIFRGLEVTEKTVPVDAVFYGAVINKSVYDAEREWGYLVPDNDLYSTVNPLTNEPQPFFGQGTNTFMYKDVALDVSEFLMLGGMFDTGKLYKGRSATYKRIATCPDDAGLADIESGDGVSVILE